MVKMTNISLFNINRLNLTHWYITCFANYDMMTGIQKFISFTPRLAALLVCLATIASITFSCGSTSDEVVVDGPSGDVPPAPPKPVFSEFIVAEFSPSIDYSEDNKRWEMVLEANTDFVARWRVPIDQFCLNAAETFLAFDTYITVGTGPLPEPPNDVDHSWMHKQVGTYKLNVVTVDDVRYFQAIYTANSKDLINDATVGIHQKFSINKTDYPDACLPDGQDSFTEQSTFYVFGN